MRDRRLILFAAAVAVQVVILVLVPARKAMTRATGRTVLLKVEPVDPYSVLSGYHVVLGFEISRPSQDFRAPESGEPACTVIEQGADGVWHPVAWAATRAGDLPEDRLAICGKSQGWRIEYGIEDFFVPEARREEIADALRKSNGDARAEVKVDDEGRAALVRLIIAGVSYE